MKKLLIALVAMMIVLSGCGMGNFTQQVRNEETIDDRQSVKKTYEIGTDIEPGDYYFVSDIPLDVQADGEALASGRVLLTKSLDINTVSEEIENVLVEDIVANTYYLTIGKDDGYLILYDATLYPANEHPNVVKNSDGTYPPGDYKVGGDIPAGSYEITPIEGISEYNFYIKKDAKYEESSSISSYIIMQGETQTVTLEDGQYLSAALMKITPK